jgi:hypothetical protein
MLGGHPAGTPLALFPPQWGIDRLLPIVDSFVQLLDPYLVDKLDSRQKSRVPYPAKVVGYGAEVEGGWNPTVVAFHVRDFQVLPEDETDIESVTFTLRCRLPVGDLYVTQGDGEELDRVLLRSGPERVSVLEHEGSMYSGLSAFSSGSNQSSYSVTEMPK